MKSNRGILDALNLAGQPNHYSNNLTLANADPDFVTQ